MKSVVELLITAGFAKSKSEARRAILGGGVRIDNIAVTDPEALLWIEEEKWILGKLREWQKAAEDTKKP
jgi:tyrosyl-tRNA synthetase